MAGLNATQGSLLGFLFDQPRTGWELLQEVERGLSRFWNVTPSHVYRELRTLEERALVRAGEPGVRDRRPFTITAAGRRAFEEWIRHDPGPEQIRMPLLVKLWFGQHLDADTLRGFLEASRACGTDARSRSPPPAGAPSRTGSAASRARSRSACRCS